MVAEQKYITLAWPRTALIDLLAGVLLAAFNGWHVFMSRPVGQRGEQAIKQEVAGRLVMPWR
jgi:hypothetical protein